MQEDILDNRYFCASHWLNFDSDRGDRSSGPVTLNVIVGNSHAGHYTLHIMSEPCAFGNLNLTTYFNGAVSLFNQAHSRVFLLKVSFNSFHTVAW